MHRIHHSVHQPETDSNYGFNFAFWDRIFKTYTVDPKDGHEDMLIGLNEHRDKSPVKLFWNLLLPFQRAKKH